MLTSLCVLQVEDLYAWVDSVPLSRPKRNIARDFSDGVLMAEILVHFYPKLIELHNYSAANAAAQKMYNWQTLNNKAFKRLSIEVTQEELESVCTCKPMAIERLLFKVPPIPFDPLTLAQSSDPHGAQVMKVVNSRVRPTSRGPRRDSACPQLPAQRAGGGRPMHVPQTSPPVSGRQSKSPSKARGDQGARHLRDRMLQASPPRGSGGQGGLHHGGNGGMAVDEVALQREVDTEILVEKEQTILELRETVSILETKVKKLEQLVRLKDAKIQALSARLP